MKTFIGLKYHETAFNVLHLTFMGHFAILHSSLRATLKMEPVPVPAMSAATWKGRRAQDNRTISRWGLRKFFGNVFYGQEFWKRSRPIITKVCT